MQDVLIQKLGEDWYAFTVTKDKEILYVPIPKGVTNMELYEVVEEL